MKKYPELKNMVRAIKIFNDYRNSVFKSESKLRSYILIKNNNAYWTNRDVYIRASIPVSELENKAINIYKPDNIITVDEYKERYPFVIEAIETKKFEDLKNPKPFQEDSFVLINEPYDLNRSFRNFCRKDYRITYEYIKALSIMHSNWIFYKYYELFYYKTVSSDKKYLVCISEILY